MNKLSKDRISLYMFRNSIATLCAAILSMMISLMGYYQCSIVEALQRLFIFNRYTTFYFLLLWLVNYLIFEISKIIYDIYEEKVTFFPCLVFIAFSVVIFMIPILDVFQYNGFFLFLLLALRMIKEMWKRTPQLFSFLHKKRPDSGLK